MSLPDEPLEPAIRDELRRRFGGAAPRADLENEVVAALRAERLLGQTDRRRVWRRRAVAVAVALALFLGGYSAAFLTSPGPAPVTAPAGSLYLLLLREPRDAPPLAAEDEEARVAEYTAWARREARAGRLVLGEKLGRDRLLVAADPPAPLDGSTAITGLFLIRAASLESARQIARSCPHVRHGGTVEVRPVVPT